MSTYLNKLVEERTSLTSVMESLRDKAVKDDRDLSDAERTEIGRMQERAVELDGLLTDHNAQLESARAFAALSAKIEENREAPVERRGPGPSEYTSPGQLFIESRAYAEYPGRGQSGAVEVTGFLPELETRAPITTANLSIAPYQWATKEQSSVAPLVEVMGKVRVSSGVVEWVEIGGDPTAAVVAEGAAKPEAAMTFTPVSATLDTLAHWMQITRQALADATYIRSTIENKLRRGLLKKIEADAAALLGASTAIQAASATAALGGLTTAIRTGIGKVEGAGYRPNAIVLNPADYAALDIEAAKAGMTGPDRRSTFWGLPTVSVPGVVAGNAYVGDFDSGLTLFDRGVSDVFVTDSHASLFISNILVILAETRVKSAITEPLALCECTVAP